uniref:RH70210p n=1 Tax=Drosophila melanogaster TaxID=7227 RepID=Q8SXD8_DROME|nr:RH70210p [Drosophila melanogaster]
MMALRKTLVFNSALLLVLLLAESQAKPSQDLNKPQTKEPSDLGAGAGAARGVPVAAKNKTAVVEDTSDDSDSEAESEEQQRRSYPHRDEDQLNSATILVLAQNYKYDVEILESGDADQDDSSMDDVDDLEERFKGRGVIFSTDTETFANENIEMSPLNVQADAVSQGHVLLGIVVVALALVSIGLYAGLVIWRSHLEQRYGMRERLVNHDLEDEAAGVDDVDYQVYAPTTTAATPRA